MPAVHRPVPRGPTAPLLAVLLLALAGCGGGGGGGDAAPTGTTASGTAVLGASGGSTAAGSTTAPDTASSGTTAPSSEVRYAMGATTTANSTTDGYQTLEGMATTADGGYRIVWSTAAFDANGQVQTTWFEQRYDAAGQVQGGETVIPAPADTFSDSRNPRIAALGGGALQFSFTNQMRPGLVLQHVSDTGAALDPSIELGSAAHGWAHAGVRLSNDTIAITWQPISSVGPGELRTAVLTPGPR